MQNEDDFLKERLFRQTEKTEGCWTWYGSRTGRGYGHINYKRLHIYVHRLSYALHQGIIPEGLWVLHSCDNPACIRPDHLFLGTRQDNIDDMVAKGRHRRDGPKLNREQAEEIKYLISEGSLPQKTIAQIYGVSDVTITNIKQGSTWQ